LGTVPDADVAKKAGVSVRTIASFRARHGIPGYSGPRRPSKNRRPRTSRIDPYQSLLGTVPDRVVAERAGVSLNAVRNYRVKRGIQAARRRSGHAVDAVVVTEPLENGELLSGAQAWKVTIVQNGKEQARVVVASTLVEAATRAAQSGRVTGVQWVAQIL